MFACFYLSQFSLADDAENTIMHTHVAKDLFGKGGLFYKNQDFLSVYLDTALKEVPGETQVNLLMTKLMSPDTLSSHPAISRLQHRIINNAKYRQHFRTQLKLALDFGNSVWDSLKVKNKHHRRHSDAVWHERKRHSEAALFLGMLSSGGLVGLSVALGAPTFIAQLAPIIGLPVTGILWRKLLARPFTRNSRLELQWAENEFKEIIANMGDKVCEKVGISLINKPQANGKANFTEVLKLAEHPDGSPLLVTKEDLLSVLHFRNSLPVYKGFQRILQSDDQSLSYPSRELKNTWGTETVLSKATIHSNILIPVDFRMGGVEGEPEQKLDTLTEALKLLFQEQIFQLKHPKARGQTQLPCTEILARGQGE